MADVMLDLTELQRRHRSVALKILVCRSVGIGTLADDASAVALERVLWAKMGETEQVVEQAWLASEVWMNRGALRTIEVATEWDLGERWVGKTVTIVDSAFGLSVAGYRPWSKGPYGPGVEWAWLWVRGYQVIAAGADSQGWATMVVLNPSRLIAESERLMGLLAKAGIEAGQFGGGYGQIEIRGEYDPVQGVATMRLVGTDTLAALLGGPGNGSNLG